MKTMKVPVLTRLREMLLLEFFQAYVTINIVGRDSETPTVQVVSVFLPSHRRGVFSLKIIKCLSCPLD